MSCDGIGEFVPTHFSPQFKEDPYHIPGYGGFVPQFQYRSEGKTFSNATKSLFENPCVASSGKLVLSDISDHDGASLIKPGFECKVWEKEMKKCQDIQQRCLPGCYSQLPVNYPQSYLFKPAVPNVLCPSGYEEKCRNNQLPAVSCEENHYHCGQMDSVACAGGYSRATPHSHGCTSGFTPPKAQSDFEPLECRAAARIANLAAKKKNFRDEYLICPSQTVYDPKNDCRYFMFSQQNQKNCGKFVPRPTPSTACVSMSSCKDICPCPQTKLKIRQLYPECGGMVSGYGGFVPGMNDCSLGENYKKATARVLNQVVGGIKSCPGPWTLKLPDCDRKRREEQRTRKMCGGGEGWC